MTGGNSYENEKHKTKTLYVIAIMAVMALFSGCISPEANQNTQVNPTPTSQITTPAKVSPTPGSTAATSTVQTGPKFVIVPKVGIITESDIDPKLGFQQLRSYATEDPGDTTYVLEKGKALVLDVSRSIVPNPPAIYQFDSTRDRIVDTPFQFGSDLQLFNANIVYRTNPLPEACTPVTGGETCVIKITGTDTKGNKGEFNLKVTIIY